MSYTCLCPVINSAPLVEDIDAVIIHHLSKAQLIHAKIHQIQQLSKVQMVQILVEQTNQLIDLVMYT